MRSKLLAWYDKHKRELPWRSLAAAATTVKVENGDNSSSDDGRQRAAYAVWVSEIMLQQTQVATVIDYYNRWMSKWPSVSALSKASLEEVNEVSSGLGYYSRGRRLLEGAQKVEREMGGRLPTEGGAAALEKELSGVGKYTSCAIASIALGQAVGVVDGNVIRVVSRLRRIGADSTAKTSMDAYWKNAHDLVDRNRPGDFNQGLMELGATVCTPKNPNCSKCPLKQDCQAYQDLKSSDSATANLSPDIENCADCTLCIPRSESYSQELGVTNYPRKGKKAAQRVQKTLVGIFKCGDKFLLHQRPETGLLANLFEFPALSDVTPDSEEPRTKKEMSALIQSQIDGGDGGLDFSSNGLFIKRLGEVVHLFSHIRQTYVCWLVETPSQDFAFSNCEAAKSKWMTAEEIKTSAISTAMKKVFKLLDDDKTNKKTEGGKAKNQPSIASFFAKKS